MRFLLCIIFVFEICAPLSVRAGETELKVGFIAALSGPAQAYGEAARNGFELALEDTGDRSIHVIYEDDQFIPIKTITAFNKLTQVDLVDVLICIGSSTCNAIAPLAETKHIPLIGWASDPHASKNRKFVIRSYPSGEEEGIRAGEEALKRNFSKIAVVSAIHDYPISWHTGVLSKLSASALLLDEQVPPDMHDFKPLLLKAKQKGVESFVICIMPGQVGVFAKQSREMGMKPKIGGCEFLQDENEAKVANGALTGAWYIEIPILPDFVAKYKWKYGNENALAGAAIHYDLFKLLSFAVKEKGLTNLAKSLMDIGHFQGVTGLLTMRNDNGDHFFDYNLEAKEIAAE
jgi:branched-chain amino acid transport system substrate-binding protein